MKFFFYNSIFLFLLSFSSSPSFFKILIIPTPNTLNKSIISPREISSSNITSDDRGFVRYAITFSKIWSSEQDLEQWTRLRRPSSDFLFVNWSIFPNLFMKYIFEQFFLIKVLFIYKRMWCICDMFENTFSNFKSIFRFL